MTTQALPGMGSLGQLLGWLKQHEQILGGTMLVKPEGDELGNVLCALFLTQKADGAFQLRACEGQHESWMTWSEQTRLSAVFGRSYAEGVYTGWIVRRAQEGWRELWTARDQPSLERKLPTPAVRPSLPA